DAVFEPLQLRFLAGLLDDGTHALRLIFHFRIAAEHTGRQRRDRDDDADDHDDDEDFDEREAARGHGASSANQMRGGYSRFQLPMSAFSPSPPSWPSAPYVQMSYSWPWVPGEA